MDRKQAYLEAANSFPYGWEDDPLVMYQAVISDSSNLEKCSRRIRENEHFIYIISSVEGYLSEFCDDKFWDNKEFLMKLAEEGIEWSLWSVSDRLTRDIDIIERASDMNGIVDMFGRMPLEIPFVKDVFLKWYEYPEFRDVTIIPIPFRNDKQVCKAVAEIDLYACAEFMSEDLWKSGFVKECIHELNFRCYCEKNRIITSVVEKYYDNPIWTEPKKMMDLHVQKILSVELLIIGLALNCIYPDWGEILNLEVNKELAMNVFMHGRYHGPFKDLRDEYKKDKGIISAYLESGGTKITIHDIIFTREMVNDLEFIKLLAKHGLNICDSYRVYLPSVQELKIITRYFDGEYIKYLPEDIRNSEEWKLIALKKVTKNITPDSYLCSNEFTHNYKYVLQLVLNLGSDVKRIIDKLDPDIIASFEFLEEFIKSKPLDVEVIFTNCKPKTGCCFYGDCNHETCKQREFNILTGMLKHSPSLITQLDDVWSLNLKLIKEPLMNCGREQIAIFITKEVNGKKILDHYDRSDTNNLLISVVSKHPFVLFDIPHKYVDLDIVLSAFPDDEYHRDHHIVLYMKLPHKFQTNLKVIYKACKGNIETFNEIPYYLKQHCLVDFCDYLRRIIATTDGNGLPMYNNDYDIKITYN